ncbi:MAG: stage II sporulation protein D [Clostridia bacterium]
MKEKQYKITIYFLGAILLCFLLPVLASPKFKQQEKEQERQERTDKIEPGISTYDYQSYQTIKLFHNKTGEVQEIKLDDYLDGVVASEMPVDFELEALKAQAVVARTYTFYKILHQQGKHEGADICDNSACCQAWISKEDRLAKWPEENRQDNWNKILAAVNSTQGKIITYDGAPIDAFFHSNSGGKTEMPSNVWGGNGYPYLQVVETAGEENYTQYSSKVELSKEEVLEKMKEKYADIEILWEQEDAIKILDYTEGNRVKTIKIGNKEIAGVEARTIFGLKSADFTVGIDGNKVIFQVIGYGHGVGMSQTGADSLAKQGKNYEEIIKHFYTGVEIEDYTEK